LCRLRQIPSSGSCFPRRSTIAENSDFCRPKRNPSGGTRRRRF
jgi:hypothetical protein